MWIFSLFFGGNRVQTFFFALSTTMFGDTYERSYPEYVRCFLRVLTINACGQALRVLYLFFVIFLSVVCQKKLISNFWDLNQGQKSCLQSSPLLRLSTTSRAACNFCPDQLVCVRLPRPVRVHRLPRLPRKLGLCAAAPIVRAECGRGLGSRSSYGIVRSRSKIANFVFFWGGGDEQKKVDK